MNKLDQEYAIFSANYGDSTPPSFEDWLAARDVTYTSKFPLSEDDVKYIRYTDTKGDSTPMGFQEWKEAGKPTS